MTIKMKAMRSFGYAGVNEGSVSRGHEFSVRDEHRAKELEAHELAYRLSVKADGAAPKNKMDPAPSNKAVDAGPFDLAGGRIGAEAPAPSSPPAQPPRRRRSSNSKDESQF